ncbi:MAG: hypothetical protein HC822_19720 [Oscillochloris sp.]|nr:hypothetical protein [Oscillochloris sp.]
MERSRRSTGCAQRRRAVTAQPGDEIWVRAGVYYPAPAETPDVLFTFQLRDGVAIYGGFAGSETSRMQRDSTANRTILSGDIDRNDPNSDGNFINETWADIQGSNSRNVVSGGGTGITAVLDGFTITGGDGDTIFSGGGIYNFAGSPTLRNLVIQGNRAAGIGGGVYNQTQSNPRYENVIISGNYAALLGGGVGNAGASNPIFINVTISGNQAELNGGGVFNTSAVPTFINSVISGNRAVTGSGGGVANSFAEPVFINSTISANRSEALGTGIFNENSTANATITTLHNSIVWGNSGPSTQQVFNADATAQISYNFSLVQNLDLGGTNLNGTLAANNPQFVAPQSGANAPTSAGDYRLSAASVAIDAGDQTLLPPDLTLDRVGMPRFIDGDRDGTVQVDLGAFEAQLFAGATITPPLLQVLEGGAGMRYSIVLNQAPTADITISIIADAQSSTDRNQVIFTPSNWSIPQEVLVQAIDDQLREGTHSGVLQHRASGADLGASVVALDVVGVTISDNDTPGVWLNPTTLRIIEGETAAYSIVLTDRPQAEVTIEIEAGEQLVVNHTALTFTPENWNIPQAVIVGAVNDGIIEATHSADIQHRPRSSDPGYDQLDAIELMVTIDESPATESPGEPAQLLQLYLPFITQ